MAATATPELTREVRVFVYEHFRDHASPPVLEQIMMRWGLGRGDAFEALRGLEATRQLKLVPGTQRILMAFPFSAIATPFRVTAGGRKYYANCAWDAIAMHATLGVPVHIESHCHHCAQVLEIDMADGHVIRTNAPEALVYLALPAARWWDDIVTTCSNHMVFFLSEGHMADWRSANPDAGGEALTLAQTHALGLPIYRDKMKLDYARPAKDALVAHFASLGFVGEFWRL